MTAKRILITGGTGLIGSYLVGALLDAGNQVTLLTRTTRFSQPEALTADQRQNVEFAHGEMQDIDLLAELIDRADVVFHKAANQGIFGAVENVQDFLQSSLGATSSLVDVLRKAKKMPEKIILGSSISVYGEGQYDCKRCGLVRPNLRYSVDFRCGDENDWNPRCPICGNATTPASITEEAQRFGESVYAVARKAQEDLLAGVCNLCGISMFGLRYSTVLGAGQSWHNSFTRFLDRLSIQQSPVLHEDGQQTRDFIFVEDVVEANLLVLKNSASGVHFYNVGSGKAVSLFTFVEQVSSLMATRLDQAKALPMIDYQLIPGEVRHCFVDLKKSKSALNFEPRQDFENGLARMVDWYLKKKRLMPNMVPS